MKKILLLAVLVVIVIVGTKFVQKDTGVEDNLAVGEGTLFIGITDDTADMQSVNDIAFTVDKIEVYNATRGWVTVSAEDRSYNLVTLKAENKTELYAEMSLSAETYDKVRVTIGNVVVDHAVKGRVTATLPSRVLTFNARTVVRAEEESSLVLDILADASLHATTKGDYVFAPVIEVQSRSNAEVDVTNNNEITVTGGSVDSNIQIGVNLTGMTQPNFKLNTSGGLDVNVLVDGGINFILGGKTYTPKESEEDASANMNTSSETDADVRGNGINLNTSTNTEVELGL